MSSNPTGSGLERAIMCTASVALTQAGRTTDEAVAGTENHERIEVALGTGGEVPAFIRELTAGAAELVIEPAFVLDVAKRSVRFVGCSVQRNYGPLSPTEIALTLDLIIVRPTGVTVVDWKSRKRVTPAAKNWQVRAQALAVLVHRGLAELTAGIGYLDNGELDMHTFDALDVPAMWGDLERAMQAWRKAETDLAKGVMPRVHSGSWCEYCPALSYCPEQTRLALVMIDELSDVERQIESMTPEQAGRAWVKLQQVEAIAKRVADALKLRARTEPLYLDEGRVVMAVEMPGRMSLDREAVEARYAELGEAVPMKRGNGFVTVKEVVRKKREKAA